MDHCDLSSKCLTCSQLMQLSRRVTGSCVNECTHAWFSMLCKASSQHFPSDRTCLPWPPLLRLSVNKGSFCWSQSHHLWRGWRDIDERRKNGQWELETQRGKRGWGEACLGGVEGQENWDRGLDNCSTMEIVFDLWGVRAYLVGNVPGWGML